MSRRVPRAATPPAGPLYCGTCEHAVDVEAASLAPDRTRWTCPLCGTVHRRRSPGSRG